MTRYFAIATREELWIGGQRLESRLSHGTAIHGPAGISATDERADDLAAECDRAVEEMRAAVSVAAIPQARLVAEARPDGVTALIVATLGGMSVVTTTRDLDADWQLLRGATPAGDRVAVDYRRIPLVWHNGSAAVLLHEAAGHAAEHRHPPIGWPRWLSVRDGETDLLAGGVPSGMRRASFGDVPLPRMNEIVASQTGAPFEMPDPRVEVLLVDGGSYEPLTETVAVHVAAARFVENGVARDVEPFSIVESRSGVARSLAGAAGGPLRYPGVICSREGQEIFVGSFAPLMATVFR